MPRSVCAAAQSDQGLHCLLTESLNNVECINLYVSANDDDEFRFNDASTHEGHLRQNGELTWFCSETIIMISHYVSAKVLYQGPVVQN